MTVNQFNYAQLRNTERANLEAARHNRATEAQEAAKLEESRRHAMVSESIDRQKADETIRHDVLMEGIQSRANEITDIFNKGKLSQGAEQLRQTGLTSSAQAEKTRAESGLLFDSFNLESRRVDADIYSKYRTADASTSQAESRAKQVEIAKFQAGEKAVIDSANLVLNGVSKIASLAGGATYAGVKADPTIGDKLRQRAAGRKVK